MLAKKTIDELGDDTEKIKEYIKTRTNNSILEYYYTKQRNPQIDVNK